MTEELAFIVSSRELTYDSQFDVAGYTEASILGVFRTKEEARAYARKKIKQRMSTWTAENYRDAIYRMNEDATAGRLVSHPVVVKGLQKLGFDVKEGIWPSFRQIGEKLAVRDTWSDSDLNILCGLTGLVLIRSAPWTPRE